MIITQSNFNLGSRDFGCDSRVFIIAEAGVNHNGDVEIAKNLIREAKRCGADCVKFQTFVAERVASAQAPKANYQLKLTDPEESQFSMLKSLELSLETYGPLFELCQKEKIEFLSTPYNMEDVDFLDGLGVGAFKVASGQIIEPEFLEFVARKKKLIILSTGMATLAEVDEAVRIIRNAGNEQIVLLQCTTNYPSSPHDANILAMRTMGDALGVLTGYSDHTQTDTAAIVAVALGARVIEKHFTLDKGLPGPDQTTSADPVEFRRFVQRIREAECVLGSGRKEPVVEELKNASAMRRSLVAKDFIPAGTLIAKEMLTCKRPGTGIPPKAINDLLGQTAKIDIPEDTMISFEFFK